MNNSAAMGREFQSRGAGWMDVPLMPAVGACIIFLAGVFNLIDIDQNSGQVTLDPAVLTKLCICGLAGLYGAAGFWITPQVRRVVFSFPCAWMLCIFLTYCLSLPFAMDPLAATASTLSIICLLLGTVTACVQLGRFRVTKILFLATTVFVAISWFAYLVKPEIGVFMEPLQNGQFAQRMGGVAHPNTLGQYAAINLLIGGILWCSYGERGWFRTIVLVLALGALAMSLSRAAMVAAVVAIVVAYRNELFRFEYRFLFLAATSLVSLVLLWLALQGDIGNTMLSRFTSLSKSGDIQELTSLTGRTDIWQRSVQLIRERPFTGYGPTSSKELLSQYSMYTHNLVLNVAFSTGLVGGLLALLMCLSRFASIFRGQSQTLPDALVAFVVVSGLVENVIFENITGLLTMVWIVGLIWFQLEGTSDVNDEQDREPELSTWSAEDHEYE